VRGEVPGDPPQVYATATVPLRILR
jgi:hypothetical protein